LNPDDAERLTNAIHSLSSGLQSSYNMNNDLRSETLTDAVFEVARQLGRIADAAHNANDIATGQPFISE